MHDDILASGGERSRTPHRRSWRLPRRVRLGRAGQVAAAVVFALALLGGVASLRQATPAPPPPPVHRASIDLPYYPPPPRLAIPTPRAVPHTTLVGGTLPATGTAPSERSAFGAMTAVVDHYCFRHNGGGALSLKPVDGYRHVIALVNPPWLPEIDIELWWTGKSYRWQAQNAPLLACG